MLDQNPDALRARILPRTDLDPRGVVHAGLLIQLAGGQRKLLRAQRRTGAHGYEDLVIEIMDGSATVTLPEVPTGRARWVRRRAAA